MSFINTKNINSHIYLYALTFEPLKSSPDAQIKRLNLLAKTRRFDELLNVSQEVKDISFPTLSKSIPFYIIKKSKSLNSKPRN